jgi:hypothetical protein
MRIITKSESSFRDTFPLKDEMGIRKSQVVPFMRIINKSESSFRDTFPLKDEMGMRESQVVLLCEL